MARLGGGCALPLGAFAEPSPRGVQMLAIALSPDGSRIARTEVDGATPDGGGRARRAGPVGRRRRRDPRARPPVKPLAGRTVLVTRPRPEAEALARLLERRGATAIVAPAIELVPVRSAALTRALAELEDGAFAWVTLTSPRTVRRARRAPDAGPGPGQGRRGRRRDGRTRSAGGAGATPTSSRRRSRPPRSAARSRRGPAACSRRAPTSRPEGLEDALARKGWTPDARRRLPDPDAALAPRRGSGRAPLAATSTPSRSRAPPRCAGSCARWAW